MKKSIIFTFVTTLGVSLAACGGSSTGTQSHGNAATNANAGSTPMMTTNQIANTPAAVGGSNSAVNAPPANNIITNSTPPKSGH